MKRILLVALTVALALGLAATAYAGELLIDGKEAGMTISYTNGTPDQANYNNMAIDSFYVKAATVTFNDGSFVFWVKDLTLSLNKGDEWTLKNDWSTFYAETGGAGLNFILCNDKSKWLPYLGYLKPASALNKNAKFLFTMGGEVAGIKVNANAYRSEQDNVDMNLSAAHTVGDITVDGFVGDFNGTDYYGGGVQVANVISGGTFGAGVYTNTNVGGNGLAYVVGVAGVKVGNITIDANYKFGNDKVSKLTAGEWKDVDSSVPKANTKEFYTKAEVPFDLFEIAMTVTGEYTRYITPGTNKFKITDKFAISDTIKDVVLSAEFGDGVTAAVYGAEATIVPGIAGLELYPRVERTVGQDVLFSGGAKYVVGGTTLLGGLTYQTQLNMWFVFGDSSATYGPLDTRIAGLYLNKSSVAYRRAYAKATTNLNEYLTNVGVQFLYRQDGTAGAKISTAVGGTYAVSSDTNLSASYIFRDWSTNHLYLELKKTVGSATFTLSYGDNDDYKDENDNDAIHELTHKKFLKKDGLPWKSFQGDDTAVQNKIKASVTVKF